MKFFFNQTRRLNSFGLFLFVIFSLLSAAVSYFDFQNSWYLTTIYLLFLAYVVYFIFCQAFLNVDLSQLTLKWPIFITISILATLLMMMPGYGNDFYHYVAEDLILVKYHLNPYLVSPSQLPFEPATWLSFWRDLPAQHGPWRIILTLPAAVVTASNFVAGIISYKIITAGFFLATAVVFYKLLIILNIAEAKRGLLLLLWNPLMLFGTFAGGGTDILMTFWLLLSLYFAAKHKWLPSIAAISISILVKYVTILILPLLMMFFISTALGAAKKIYFLLKQTLVFTVIVGVSFYPFWAGFKIFAGLLWVSHFFDLSSFPGFIGSVLLLVDPNFEPYSLKLPFELIFIAIYFFILLKFFLIPEKKIQNLVGYSALIIGVFLILGKFWFYPKYLIWLLPLLLLSGKKFYWLAIFLSGLIVGSPFPSVPLPVFFIVPSLVFGVYFYLKDLAGFEI
ncbi:MAG: hypothetical protein PHW95_01870 [Patescibacteria group bacterium]|nr:hypothetical protein [Patescibacteria group bacterium]